MGLAKQRWIEQREEEYERRKSDWIRMKLGNPDADESSEGWDELAGEYDMAEGYREKPYEDDWSVLGKSRIDIFFGNINASKEILGQAKHIVSVKNLLVMLHAHVVTSVEAYLSATFIELALCAEPYMRKLVETDPAFAKRQITMKEIFAKREALKDELSQYLKDLIFHDIAKVKEMYLSVLDINFGDTAWLFKAVVLRHHCVHRAGYDKEGEEVELSVYSITELIEHCTELVLKVERVVQELPRSDDPIFGRAWWKT